MVYTRTSQLGVGQSPADWPKSVHQKDGTWRSKGGIGHFYKHGPDAAPKPGDTVIVIGAGPAGIHMAELLVERGIRPIVLEKSERVGGKVCTVVHDGVPHEMGACYLTPEYHILKDLLKKYNCDDDLIKLQDRDIHLEDSSRHPVEVIDGLSTWAKRTVKEYHVQKGTPFASALPDNAFGPDFFLALRRFQAAHRKAMGNGIGYYGLLPPRPSPEQWRLLNMPFADFLKEHNCEAMKQLLLIAVTSQGYGLLEHVPAMYAMIWFTAEFAEAFLQTILHPKAAEPVITLLRGGHLKLFQRMAAKLDVRALHEVRKIVRTSTGVKVIGVRVDGCSLGAGSFSLNGTHVFIACPFVPLAKTMKLTPAEARIVADLRPNTFCTHLVERDPRTVIGNPKNVVASWPDRIMPDGPLWKVANMYAERWSLGAVRPKPELAVSGAKNAFERISNNAAQPYRAEDLSVSADKEVLADKKTDGKQVVVCNQFVEEGKARLPDGSIDVPFLQRRLAEDLEMQGVTGWRLIKTFPWEYFYHFSAEGLSNGLPWDLLEMQGENRTFWIGSSACFESINDVTNYNLEIVTHFFGK